MASKQLSLRTGRTVARRVLAQFVLVASVGLAGCTSSKSEPDVESSVPSVSPAVSATVVSQLVIADRPAIPPDDVRAERLDNLAGSSYEPELAAAVASSVDWAGTLTGQLLRRLPDGQWKLCFVLLESYPASCGAYVDLSREPAVRSTAAIDVLYDTVTSGPVQEVSGAVTITGVFLYDSLLFVPDA